MDSIRWGHGPAEVVVCSRHQKGRLVPDVPFTRDLAREWAEVIIDGVGHARSIIGQGGDQVWQMRCLLAGQGETDVSRLNDHQVINRIASRLTHGQLVLFRRVRTECAKLTLRRPLVAAQPSVLVSPSSFRSRQKDEEAAFGQDARVAQVARPAPAMTHWIEIELIGEDDAPIASEAYAVELPGGEVVTGYLNQKGWARIEAIASPGECRISFPRLDRRAWGRA